MVQHFRDSMECLDEWMRKLNMAPNVQERIKHALLSWKERGTYALEPSLRAEVEVAFKAQEKLGWSAFLEGCISTT